MLSRVAGALRDVAIGHVFGAGRAADVFWIAFTIPNVFRRFVADEGLTGVVIPALDRAEEEEGEEPARRLAGATLAFLLLVCLGLCVLGILAAPWVVRAFAWGFSADPDKLALTVALTRWLFPFLLFVCLVSYCEGLLNRRDHYFVPKLAPGLVSCCIVAAALLLAHRQEEPLFALVVGVLVGGAVHLLVCLPPLISRWGLPRPLLSAMRGPRFARFVVEMGKVVLIGVFGQLNIMALRTLASLLPEGSVTHYWFANRVVDLAQGVVAVSVGSALMRVLSQAATRRDWPAFAEHFGDAVRLLGVVLLPAACLLVVLAEPAVSLLFRHGEFDAAAVDGTVPTLRLLVPFMLAVAGVNLAKKPYFALDERGVLLGVGALGLALTVALGAVLIGPMGVAGLGLALSLSTAVQLAAYLVVLPRRTGISLGLTGLLGPLARMLAASLPAAAAALAVSSLGRWDLGPASLRNWAVMAGAWLAALVVYAAAAWLLRVRELRRLADQVLRRGGG